MLNSAAASLLGGARYMNRIQDLAASEKDTEVQHNSQAREARPGRESGSKRKV